MRDVQSDPMTAIKSCSTHRCLGLVRKITIFVLLLHVFTFARVADDATAAARASLERIRLLRKERPGDGVLVFYEALLRGNLGEHDAAFALLRSLKWRKLGL